MAKPKSQRPDKAAGVAGADKYLQAKKRRRALMGKIGKKSIALLSAAPQRTRSNDTEYPYRQDSDFYYLTGFTEDNAVLALIPGRKQGEVVLFCQPKDKTKELWTGILTGPEQARTRLLLDEAYPISMIDDILPGLMDGCERVYYCMEREPTFDQRVSGWVKNIRSRTRMGAKAPHEFVLLDPLLHEMRLFKSKSEIALMQTAADISARAHKRAMLAAREGRHEYHLEAELVHEFMMSGSRAPAYNSIVAAGANACILHYIENRDPLRDGDLVLIDAGCEYDYYAADITRTFPVSGHFSAEQKALYGIVLKAQLEAIAVTRPGVPWDEPHHVTVRIITHGLVELGLLKGDPDKLIETGAYRDFYMHRAGHWLGIDVHDAGSYLCNDKPRRLEPGMVMTVEPGIYVSPDNKKVAKKWRGIGIRIEDDVLVTKTGNKVLSDGVPKTTEAIETLMARRV
ncbi:MAG: Xaa-Pro aminopeptidase [Pseudohongiella sp.]|uniref:Xaa-Pro aminopeptidase n=1 Tax=Pseudohongiella sp. TaxID=1979412 RepID=UPI0034A096B8